MYTVEKVLHLRQIPFFSGMESRELERLASIVEEVIFPAGSRIIEDGEDADSMYFIAEGKVRVHKRRAELRTLEESAYFGEMSLLDREPRSASVTAITDCLLLRLKHEDFHDILIDRPEVAVEIIRTLTQKVRRLEAAAYPDSGSV